MVNSEKEPKNLVLVATGRIPKRMPIWFLRQAGRYLPEYREIREGRTFLDLCLNPDLATEVTMMPIRRYDLDAAIVFCDILIPAMMMGQKLTFDPGHGPILEPPIRSQDDLLRLKTECSEVEFLTETLRRVRSQLAPHQSLIGFAGAPATVASYMVGGGPGAHNEVRKFAHSHPDTYRQLIEMITTVTVSYLSAQIDAGCDLIMLFDTWANLFSPSQFHTLAAESMQRLGAEIKARGVPLIYYPGPNLGTLDACAGLDFSLLHLDWRCSIDEGRQALQRSQAIAMQGNLDPTVLFGSEQHVRNEVRRILTEIDDPNCHVFNVGHGILPKTPPESIEWAIDEVRKFW